MLILLSGCPAESATGGGETGEPLPAEPIDPFDGQGSDPPGEPDPNLEWRPPTTLGNGLVYDTRFDIAEQGNVYTTHVTLQSLAAGVEWSAFVTPHASKLSVGFRPSAVDADVALTGTPDGPMTLEVADRSAYIADDEANYRHETRTYVFPDTAAEQALARTATANVGEPRPLAIDTFTLANGMPGESIVWVYDNNPIPWTIVVGDDNFTATVQSLTNKGYRPISVASRRRNGTSEHSGIFVQDAMPNSDWRLDLSLDWTTLADAADIAWADGYYPFRGAYEHGSAMLPKFDVLWARRSPEFALQFRYNLDQALFDNEDVSWRAQGYALEHAMMYADAGAPRFAGIWVRHEPYFREQIADSILDNNPNFIARYKIFEDPLIQSMTLAGEQKEGEYFRPSATLHIWEGGQLVINRAYTYAPSLYPDTPINATMAVASVSKSITAAAVVKVLAENNVPLTQSFAVAAGLNWPQGFTAPTVGQVLQHVGGFASADDAENYMNHVAIASLGYGSLPIQEDEYANYVIDAGLLGNAPTDHWRPGRVGDFLYSNPGFSMLGELVRVQAGIPYEEYVRTAILQPVNLHDNIFADRGNRNTVDQSLVSGAVALGVFEPIKADLRTYLVNTSHPYVCADNPPCVPAVPPVDSSPSPASWSPNTTTANPSTPLTAAEERYAGSVFMGGAALAAGGWHADGKSLGELMRLITRFEFLMPNAVASQLWAPSAPHSLLFEVDVPTIPAFDWSYGLGWYVRGNWVAWAGGTKGTSALVLHNLRYDFTVVTISNVIGNPMAGYLTPLFSPQCIADTPNCWGTSTLGSLFPCWDNPNTVADECPAKVIY